MKKILYLLLIIVGIIFVYKMFCWGEEEGLQTITENPGCICVNFCGNGELKENVVIP